MYGRPEIDRDRLNDILDAERAYQDSHNAPKDPPAKFCGNDCRVNYREERIQGKLLAPVSMNGKIVSHKTMCSELKLCCYCSSKLEK